MCFPQKMRKLVRGNARCLCKIPSFLREHLFQGKDLIESDLFLNYLLITILF